MNLYQVTGPVIGIGGLTVKAKDPKHASEIAQNVISENHMADSDDHMISLYVRELVQPEDDGPGYCYPETAEHVYQVTIQSLRIVRRVSRPL